jgi:spermidine synthase
MDRQGVCLTMRPIRATIGRSFMGTKSPHAAVLSGTIPVRGGPAAGARTRRTSGVDDSRKRARLAARSEPNSPFIPLLFVFALSGLAALVYQVLWGRMLTLIFGATAAATGTVLAVFMGGLALGGWGAGKRADRLARPLKVYACLEAGIGVLALIAPLLFQAAVPVIRMVWQMTGGNGAAMVIARILLACVALLPPATLMGATLPVLTRACVTRFETVGARIGLLYGVNTLGAAAGAFLSGFVLIPLLGLSLPTWLAATLNGLLAVCALVLDRYSIPQPNPLLGKETEPDAASGVPPSKNTGAALAPSRLPSEESVGGLVKFVLAGFAVSGAIALAYEVVWTRALLLVIGSNVYAFAAMLTTFLIGLFLGAAVTARFADRFRRPILVLAWLEAAVGVAAWAGCEMFNQLPWLSISLANSATLPQNAGAAILARLGLASLVMLPIALFLGALFPPVVRACATALESMGRTVGDLYAANTLGAIAGALTASFVLVPILGTQGSLRAMIAANLLLAAFFMTVQAAQSSHSALRRFAPAFALTAVAIALPLCLTQWDMLTMISAQQARRATAFSRYLGNSAPFQSQSDYALKMSLEAKVLYHGDGLSSDVAVLQSTQSGVKGLFTNGQEDATDGPDMPTQILLAALPMLLHPQPDQVAVVGWGSGVTGGVAEEFNLKHIDALEIEPDVMVASHYFDEHNHNSLDDSRLSVITQDGRNVLMATNKTYDVIISEPSNVWGAGVCNLFTRDYFKICRARMRPGGLFTQWFAYGSIPTPEVRGVYAALHQVFPYAIVFKVDSVDAIVVASAQPVMVNASGVAQKMSVAGEALQDDLQTAGILDVRDLVHRIAFGGREMPEFCGDERPNTDDNARLEFAVAAPYELHPYSEDGQVAFDAVKPADPLEYVNTAGVSAADRASLLK